MLLIAKHISQINMTQLAYVYKESNRRQANEFRDDRPEGLRLLDAEMDLYEYLCEFLRDRNSFCAIWLENDRYVAAVRIEPFLDGMLLSGLETASAERGKGIAGRLLHEVVIFLAGHGYKKVYSHIARHNYSSVSVHVRNGFVKSLDYARCVDGSILRSMDTYCLNL